MYHSVQPKPNILKEEKENYVESEYKQIVNQ